MLSLLVVFAHDPESSLVRPKHNEDPKPPGSRNIFNFSLRKQRLLDAPYSESISGQAHHLLTKFAITLRFYSSICLIPMLASAMLDADDTLFDGVPDSLFEGIAPLEDDPLFGGISDEFFNETMTTSALTSPCVNSNEEDLFGDVPDDLFESIPSPNRLSFLSLPPEIRNMVYELVFVSPANIGTNGMTNSCFFQDVVRWRNLDFAMSCRQIYTESGNIFYARNGFEFYYIRPFKEFMESIGVQRRRLITKLNFNFLKGSPFCVLRYIRSCTNMQELNISLRVIKSNCEGQGWWLYPIKNVREFIFTDFDKLELGEASGVGEARDSEARGECRVGAREKNALFTALRKVKNEDIYMANG